MKFTKGTLIDRISRYLFHYRNTPHTTTGVTPAELLLGRRPRSRLDMVQPDLCTKVSQKQQQQKQTHDLRARTRSFTIGDLVYVCTDNQTGFLLTLCRGLVRCPKLDSGIICRRHQDQLQKRFETVTEATSTDVDTDLAATGTFLPIPSNISESTPNVPAEPDVPAEPSFVQNPPFSPQKVHEEEPQEVVHRYPTRER